ncbi:zinc ABC transporter ATP-binding protein AztA [Kribbella sp. NPDC056345]|uniref:zinc ABC transporter ATP-binding protein AztA n=1 Tax=Kribbella sp. NPDC056345 TaxID=3345789 RepID=UPI0035DA0D95
MAASQVTLSAVAAGYPGRPVLSGFAAQIPAFSTTAVVGANGSGKSTLLGVLAGVIPVTAGTVVHRTKERPAFVVQRSAIADTFPLTVRETVSMGRWGHRGLWRRLTARDRAVVDSWMERLGIADLAGRQLGELSGGQRQRALVAQGLAQEADLLLLDEPTTGLDASARQAITDVLDEVTANGVTVVQATHDLAAARRTGHCVLLHDGQLLSEGPPSDVLTDNALNRVWQFAERV